MKIFSPVRISFFGGGTDLPFFYEKFCGKVFSTAINMGWHITLSPNKTIVINFEGKKIICNLNTKNQYKNDGCDFIRASINQFQPHTEGFKLFIKKDRNLVGLGSSASLIVSLLLAISKFKGLEYSKIELAEMAYDIENNELGLITGKQDAYIATHGDMHTFHFKKTGKVDTKNIMLDNTIKATLTKRSIMVYVGGKRNSGTFLQKTLIESLNSEKRIEALKQLKRNVDKSIMYLTKNDIDGFGQLLHESWMTKKISNPDITKEHIDLAYNIAMENGALGGKLCGAGQAGYLFFITAGGKKSKLINTLVKHNYKCINFAYYNSGAHIQN